ncbi:translocation/assembly module TamB domain-containing protein [bacterium]|nr:translocation/assembly module TamB domain-containing protein [bacterium]
MKRLLSWVGGLLLILLALAGMAVLFLTTAPGERLLRLQGQKLLTEQLGHPVEIGRLETNLLSRLQLKQITIRNDSTTAAQTLLSLDQALINYRLFGLFDRKLQIDAIHLDSLRIDLRRDSAGRFLLAPPDRTTGQEPDSSEGGGGFDLRLEQVLLNGGSAIYADDRIPLTGSLDGVDASVTLIQSELWHFGLKITKVNGNYEEVPLELNELISEGYVAPDRLHLDTLFFDIPGFRVEAEGGFGWGDKPAPLQAVVQIEGTPEPLSRQFDHLLTSAVAPIKGQLTMRVQLDGTLANPRMVGQVSYPSLDFPGATLKQGSLSAIYQHKTLQIKSFRSNYAQGKIAMSGSLLIDSLLTHALDIQLESVNLGDAWSNLYHEQAPYRGVIRGGLTSQGPLLRPRLMDVRGNLAMERVKYKAQPLPDFTAIGSSHKGVANLNIQQANSNLALRLRFARRVLDGEFTFRISELGPLVDLVNVSELTGRLTLEGTIKGRVDAPVIDASFDGSNLVFQDFPVDSVHGSVLYDNGTIQLGESVAIAHPTRIDPLRPPFHQENIEGTFSYEIRLHGSPENPTGSIKAYFGEPVVYGYHVDAAHLQASIKDTILQVDRLQVARDSLLIRATGTYDLPVRSGSADLAFYSIPQSKLASLDPAGRIPAAEKIPPSDYIPVGTASSWFELDDLKNIILALEAQQIQIENLLCMGESAPDISGEASFESSFFGSLEDPDGELRFTINRPRYQTVGMDSMRGDIQLDSKLLNLRNLELFLGENHSFVSLKIGLTHAEDGTPIINRGSKLEGRSEANNIDMLLMNPFLANDPIKAGITNYSLAMNGTLGKPRLRGRLTVRGGRFRISPDSPEIKQVNLGAVLNDTLLTIDSLRGVIGEAHLDLRGRLLQRDWLEFSTQYKLLVENREVVAGEGEFTSESIRMRMTTRGLNMSMLQAFTPGVKRLQGLLRSTLVVQGPTKNPNIDGHILIRGLTVQPSGMDQAFTKGTVKLNFNRKRVHLDTLAFALDQGNFLARGDFGHEDGKIHDVRMKATGNNLQVRKPGWFIFTLDNGELNLASNGDRFELDGDLYLGETIYQRRLQTSELLGVVQGNDRVQSELPNLLQRLDLNVRVRESNNVWMDNNLARLRANLDVAFLGTLEQISMNGRVVVEEGYVLFLDRKFKVENGVLDFIDPNRINPIVELTARSVLKAYQTVDGKAYTITLNIQGPVDQAQVSLTSDPPLSESDIISILTVGATREQIAGRGGAGTTMADILRQRAEDLSSQRISGYVSRKVGSAFGLEQMSVEGNLFNVSNSWGPQLLASKKLTDRMEVTYTTRVGHMNEQGIKLDYKLTEHFSVEGQTDQQGQTGLDLIYKLRFK